MSTTLTSNLKLGQPAVGDTGWATPINANTAAIDGLAPIASLAVTAHEQPSATLKVDVAAGSFRNPWGSVVAYGGAAGVAVPGSAVTYLWLDAAGTLHTGSAFPTGSAYVPLARVATSSSAVTSVADQRVACGSVNVQSQPTLGAATAGSSYGTNEQAMLQSMWNLLRNLGLGT